MTGRIRRATIDDAAAVAHIHVQGWRETYPGIVPDRVLAALDEPSRERYWRALLAVSASRTDIFLAELPVDGIDRVVGFGVCGPEQLGLAGYAGEFHALYLLRAGQGRGLGSRLMSAMAASLLRRGMVSATVWALRDNRRACRFYEKLDGRLIGSRLLDFDGTKVVEMAYGWSDVTPVARRGAVEWR